MLFRSASFNSVGSYVLGYMVTKAYYYGNTTMSSGGSYSAGSGTEQLQAQSTTTGQGAAQANILSGTWRYMGPNALVYATWNCTCGGYTPGYFIGGLFVRIA